MEKKAKTECTIFFLHTSVGDRGLRKECAQRPECTQHSSIPKSEAPVLVGPTTKSGKKLVVEPPADSGVWGLCSQLFMMSYDSLRCVGVERVETVVGQACEKIGLHSYCLQLLHETCFDQERLY